MHRAFERTEPACRRVDLLRVIDWQTVIRGAIFFANRRFQEVPQVRIDARIGQSAGYRSHDKGPEVRPVARLINTKLPRHGSVTSLFPDGSFQRGPDSPPLTSDAIVAGGGCAERSPCDAGGQPLSQDH